MRLASQKRKDNVAEYVLFMWQLCDLLRSLKMDETLIRNSLVDPLGLGAAEAKAELEWYMDLCQLMKKEGKADAGMVSLTLYLVDELYAFHLRLLNEPGEDTYQMLVFNATPAIMSFKDKVPYNLGNDIQYCFYALYSKLQLAIRKSELTKETAEAFSEISKMVAYLSKRFGEFEAGKFAFKED